MEGEPQLRQLVRVLTSFPKSDFSRLSDREPGGTMQSLCNWHENEKTVEQERESKWESESESETPPLQGSWLGERERERGAAGRPRLNSWLH